jgi:hypothetical protein
MNELTSPRPADASLELQIESLHRRPFRQALAELLGATPTPDELSEWAKTRPDRLWQCIAIASKLAGYEQKSVIEHNYYLQVKGQSDAEIEHRLAQCLRSMDPIDAEVVEPPKL